MTKKEFDSLSKDIFWREGLCGIDFKYKSCVAEVAMGTEEGGQRWATIYTVDSAEPGKGHCQTLLRWLQYRYKDCKFGSTVALNDRMRHILQKLGITEYQ